MDVTLGDTKHDFDGELLGLNRIHKSQPARDFGRAYGTGESSSGDDPEDDAFERAMALSMLENHARSTDHHDVSSNQNAKRELEFAKELSKRDKV